MYQALYRKWRPKTFDEVIGQEHITETLKTQVRTGHLSHAYIFIGTRGTGKTTCARILAKAVNCENPVNGNPCNCCRFCRGIDDGSILDIVELDAASNTGVDNVRDLREEAVFSPAAAKKRVYIIDEVHMLSLAAFNALLKIIEEPPEHLMFILATTELQKVPATILSRCQRHSFRRIPTERLADYLTEIAGREDLKLDSAAAMQIGRLAEGGVRDALSILDQCSGRGQITIEAVFETMGLAGNRNLTEMLKQVVRHNCAGALQLFQKIWLDGKEPAAFLSEFGGLIRDVMIVKAASAGADELISGNYERTVLDTFAAAMTREEILFCADTVQEAVARLRQLRSPRIAAELCLVTLCESRTADSTLSLRARISRLEEQLKDGVSLPGKEFTAASAETDEEEKLPEPEVEDELLCEEREEPVPMTDPEEIELPEVLPEEAPEDAFLEKRRPEKSAGVGDKLKELLDILRTRLPRDLRFTLDDPSRMRLSLTGNELLVEAIPGFLLERLKKPELRNIFTEAAQSVLGQTPALRYDELRQGERPRRDINELRQFKEVKFI